MFEKSKLKGFVTGVVCTSLIMGGVSIYASEAMKKNIEVIYNDVKLVVDGKPVDFGQDTTGNDIEPFIYNGTTYLPVRSVGEAMEKKVAWDGATKTIYVGKRDANDEESTYIGGGINHINYQEGDKTNSFTYRYNTEKVRKDNVGNEYRNYLVMFMDADWSYMEFPTNMEYKKFKALLSLEDEFKDTTQKVKIEIFADENLVFEKEMPAGTMPEEIDVDISNAVKVTVKATTIKNGSISKIGLFNPRFVK